MSKSQKCLGGRILEQTNNSPIITSCLAGSGSRTKERKEMDVTEAFVGAMPANMMLAEGVNASLEQTEDGFLLWFSKDRDIRGPIPLLRPVSDELPTFTTPPRLADVEAYLFLPVLPRGHSQIQVHTKLRNRGATVLLIGTAWRETLDENDNPKGYIDLDWVTPKELSKIHYGILVEFARIKGESS